MMQVLPLDLFPLVCKLQKKWGLYVCLHNRDIHDQFSEREEIEKAASWLQDLPKDDVERLICEGCASLLFDTEEEMEIAYRKTVGDDGPSELNSYHGPARMYAYTVDPNGDWISENS